MSLTVSQVRKSYPPSTRKATSVVALDGLDLDAPDGELLVVVGPSGSGKTTLLRCIAGLEPVDEGTIEVGGVEVTDRTPGERDVAMVFQEFALYPHLTVERNISFGLRARRLPSDEIAAKVSAAAELLSLTSTLDRTPDALSGGERQRVALARAIVREPKVFLMDEPLSDLDAELRAITRTEIKSLQRRLGTTMIYVTHDQIEAMTMGDRVAVLCDGRVEQTDPPMAIYDRPATSFVARFMGSPPMNLWPAGLHAGPNGAVTVGVRPERISLASPEGSARMSGTVALVENVGAEAIVHVDVSGTKVLVRTRPGSAPAPGDSVGLTFDDAHVHGFDAEGRAL